MQITPLNVVAVILVFVWGWYIRKWFFQAAAKSKPLRMTVVVVNSICLLVMAIFFIRYLFAGH